MRNAGQHLGPLAFAAGEVFRHLVEGTRQLFQFFGPADRNRVGLAAATDLAGGAPQGSAGRVTRDTIHHAASSVSTSEAAPQPSQCSGKALSMRSAGSMTQ